ncbi:MAG: ankyrin repeat domain-containing protein [Terrimicrobiaceae bacterium]|nr:ankyrin repeat domain-containing protein [Terrimicrobiaceae bacterium]
MGERTNTLKKAVVLAALGDRDGLRKLVAADADLVADPRLLNEAALHGMAAAVRLLLDSGADPDGRVPSHEGFRPLHRAIEHRGVARNPGHREAAETLIEAGASLTKRSTWMQLTPLAVAGMAGDAEMIALMNDAGAEGNIFTAAITADLPAVRRLLKGGIAASSRDENHMTVLHYAALSGLRERGEDLRRVATLLLDAGADGDAREVIGPYPATPVLHFAAWKNYAVAETLLDRGCDPNFGLGNCLWREPGPMAELFLAHGADVNSREPSGQPFLHSRIHWNLSSVALWLLKNGADPNLTDAKGNTALHEAALRGIHPKVVEALLASGADRQAKNREGQTPLAVARLRKRERIIRVLEPSPRGGGCD